MVQEQETRKEEERGGESYSIYGTHKVYEQTTEWTGRGVAAQSGKAMDKSGLVWSGRAVVQRTLGRGEEKRRK